MRKLISILFLSIMLTGCGASSDSEADAVIFEEGRFICIEMGSSWQVLADSETGVMYVVSDGMYNRGTFTMLVDADGNPLIWEGVKE